MSIPFPKIPQSPSVDADAFRLAMRHLAGGVSAITVGIGADRTGFTATSVSSLAVDPPTLIVSVNKASSSWPVVQRYRTFGVNILTSAQSAVADRFAGRGGIKGVDRFEGADWFTLATGAPLLDAALVALDCELETAIERHSYAILIGRVLASRVNQEAEPLVYWRSAYQTLAAAPLT
jgi:flavin reductase (DIM6/NTAB) family NADH-FMN oxidoreductase RutF